MTTPNSQKSFNLRSYLFFWLGQVQSQLGSLIVQFVIIFWIAIETESPFLLGIAAFAGFAPFIVLTPIAGVLVDRWNRKKIIAGMDFLQAVTTSFLVFLFWIEIVAVWHILVILALRAVFQAFHMPATEAIVPLLVPPDKLSRMNGLNWFMWGIIGIIGPVVAAVLLAYWKIYEILLLDPLTFVFAIIPVILIKIPSVTQDQPTKEKQSFKTEFSEGIGFIRERRGLLALLSVFTAVNLFGQPFYTLFPLFVLVIHSGSKEDLAILMALSQIGMLAGSVLMSTWKGFRRNVVGVVFGILFGWVGYLIVIFAPIGDPNALLIIAAGMLLMGFTLPITNVSSQTIWQQVVPPEKMGRVMSVRTTIAWFVIPIGMLLGGVLAEIIGIVTLFFVCAVLGLSCLAYSWFMTNLPNVEKALLTIGTEVPSVPPSISTSEI
ncbi:MAG: MFS transporter [Candidatus Hodarchaeota archaeon]